MNNSVYTNALGIDLGDSKIGLARVNYIARIPQPLGVLKNNDELIAKLKKIAAEYEIDTLVVGVPRNLGGEHTEQSNKLQEFANNIANELNLPLHFQDETLSSVRAQDYINTTGNKYDEDSVAACIILEDFAAEHAPGLVQ